MATLQPMGRHDVVLGLVEGSLRTVDQSRDSAPGRVWTGIQFGRAGVDDRGNSLDLDSLRVRYAEDRLDWMGEIVARYEGVSPSDAQLDPYLALAAEMDVPVGIHIGLGPPRTPYGCCPRFRTSLGDPRLLEEALIRYPGLRVYLMHAGWPYLVETKAILHMYPRVYVDLAVIDWILPRKEFTQSLHTNSMDETFALPTEKAVKIALRTQQVIAYESGVPNVIDPLGGSYFIEALTDRMEREAEAYFQRIDDLGGVVAGIEEGFFQREIGEAASRYQKEIDEKRRIIVGVNEFVDEGEELEIPILRIDPRYEREQIERTRKVREERDGERYEASMKGLRERSARRRTSWSRSSSASAPTPRWERLSS